MLDEMEELVDVRVVTEGGLKGYVSPEKFRIKLFIHLNITIITDNT